MASDAPLRAKSSFLWGMAALDVALVLAAFVLAYIIRYDLQILRPVYEFNRSAFAPYLPYAAAYVVWLHLLYRGGGLYRAVRWRPLSEEIYTIVNGVTNAALVMMALSFILQPLVFSRLMMVYAAALTIIVLIGARIVRRMVQVQSRARGVGVQRVLVIGAGEVGGAVLRTMVARKELGYHPIGYIDLEADKAAADIGRVKGLGGLDNLNAILRQHQIDLVVITLPWTYHDRILKLIQVIRRAGAEASVVPDVFQLNLRQVQVENLDGIPLLRVNGHVPMRGSNRLIKRALDMSIALVTVPLWLPILGAVALAIRLEGDGAILYRAKRIGENGQPFDMIKFRSMVPNADQLRDELTKAHDSDPRRPKIVNDPRVTRIGRFIRPTSLDELPNLFNVITGHMSLVGPRPPTPEEVSLYEPWHLQRLQTKPGITGLWQVSGRSDIPFEEMCLMDIYYIENWSIGLDAQILMMTIPRVLMRQGAY